MSQFVNALNLVLEDIYRVTVTPVSGSPVVFYVAPVDVTSGAVEGVLSALKAGVSADVGFSGITVRKIHESDTDITSSL